MTKAQPKAIGDFINEMNALIRKYDIKLYNSYDGVIATHGNYDAELYIDDTNKDGIFVVDWEHFRTSGLKWEQYIEQRLKESISD